MRTSRILIYTIIIIVGLAIAYALVSSYKGLVRSSTQATHPVEGSIGLYVQREAERRISMSIFLSIPHLGEKPSKDISRLYAVSRLALIAMPPFFTIIPDNLAKDNVSLVCRFTPLRIAQVNATSYEIRQGVRSLQVFYEFKALNKNRVLYEARYKAYNIVTNTKGFLVYENGYVRRAVFNTTSFIGNETRSAATMIHSYYKNIMIGLEAVAGPKHIQILLDNNSKVFIIEVDKEKQVLNNSIARSLAELLSRLPGSVRAKVLNETLDNEGHRVYTVLLEIDAVVDNPSGVGLKTRMTINLVETRPWLLVEASRHIEFFKAWMEIGDKTYTVTGHDISARIECSLSSKK